MAGHVISYKIKKEFYLFKSCLIDARRMSLFVMVQVFLPMGRRGILVDVQCRYTMHSGGAGRGGQRAVEIFCLKNLSLCHKLWILLPMSISISVNINVNLDIPYIQIHFCLCVVVVHTKQVVVWQSDSLRHHGL